MAYNVRILKDSISPDSVRLTTLEVTLPRLVLSEFNTHRMFSRNSASSRAIPVEKMLKRVKDDPFIPIHWGANQKGMQADKEIDADVRLLATSDWLNARDRAVEQVELLLERGIHKQITNRLLEPWLWQTIIVTATEWDNFWGLRCNKDAQPEIKHAADMMKETYDASFPDGVDYEDWHLPLVEKSEAFDLLVGGMSRDDLVKVSVGRCARISYLTHDGKRDPIADIALADRLRSSGHMSPWEHAARPMQRDNAEKLLLNQRGVAAVDPLDVDVSTMFAGNFRGWVQARKLIKNEDNFLKVQDA